MAFSLLSEDAKITVVAPTSTGTSTIDGTAIDMAGYDGALFIVRLGSPATNNNIRIRQCDTSGGTYADLEGTLVGNHASNTPLVVDLKRPQEQFLKYQITRGTTTTVDSVTVIQYRSRTRPPTQPSGTALEQHVSPAEGTA